MNMESDDIFELIRQRALQKFRKMIEEEKKQKTLGIGYEEYESGSL